MYAAVSARIAYKKKIETKSRNIIRSSDHSRTILYVWTIRVSSWTTKIAGYKSKRFASGWTIRECNRRRRLDERSKILDPRRFNNINARYKTMRFSISYTLTDWRVFIGYHRRCWTRYWFII